MGAWQECVSVGLAFNLWRMKQTLAEAPCKTDFQWDLTHCNSISMAAKYVQGERKGV